MATRKRKKKRKKNIQKDRYYPALREYKGVSFDLSGLAPVGAHSVGIGRKRVEGKLTDKLCLRYYIAKKRPLSRLSADERIPQNIRFFSRKKQQGMRLTTDIIEAPAAQFEQIDPESRIRPVPGGVSFGAGGKSGTLGGWVWDTTDDTIVMLSNEHVLGHVSGVEILQQSMPDGGSSSGDRIGEVKRGIVRSDTEPNTVDCAIGDPDDSDLMDLNVLEIGPGVFGVDVPAIDLTVEKYGQTTRHTFGEITDADWSGFVGIRPFEDCLRIAPLAPSLDWSAGGDSGAVVFSQTPTEPGSDVKPAVGLHFAGAGTHGFACKIQNVFARLDLTALSVGTFSAFLDSLFEAETDGEVSEDSEGRLRTLSGLAPRTRSFAPRPFVRSEQKRWRSGGFFYGISRDLHRRLATARGGRTLTGLFDGNQAELVTMLAKEGDVRRSVVAALRPLLAGAVTTTEVLERVLTDRDLHNLRRLSRELECRCSGRLKSSLKMVQALGAKAEGRSLADILGIEL